MWNHIINIHPSELLRLYLVTVFVFYFQKLVFGNIKKKKNFLYFLNQKHVQLVEIFFKKNSFLKKKNENTKICRYQDLNFNANSLNEIDSLN